MLVDLTTSNGAQLRWLDVRRSISVRKERSWLSRTVAHRVNGMKEVGKRGPFTRHPVVGASFNKGAVGPDIPIKQHRSPTSRGRIRRPSALPTQRNGSLRVTRAGLAVSAGDCSQVAAEGFWFMVDGEVDVVFGPVERCA